MTDLLNAVALMAEAFLNIHDPELWSVFTCHEIDAMAAVLTAAGYDEVVEQLTGLHAIHDEEGDARHSIPDA